MIPKEILAQIRKIEIRSGKLVNEIFAGQYSSVFKGRGMEFSEVREYAPGDDIRTIDWNVTARYGKLFIKKFVEERELTVMLLVDASASQKFGTRDKFKSELTAEFASVIAFSAIRNNDRVGMIIFTDRIEKVIRPKKGRNHILRLIREALYFKPEGRGTNLTLAMQYLNELWRRKAVVFLLSDFEDEDFEQALKITGKKHDLIAVKFQDPGETALPTVGILDIEDPETGKRMSIDTSDRLFMAEYLKRRTAAAQGLQKLFIKANVDSISVTAGTSYIASLIQFFRRREKRLSY